MPRLLLTACCLTAFALPVTAAWAAAEPAAQPDAAAVSSAVSASAAVSSAVAATVPGLPLPQYPAGSISSLAQAERALRDARVATSAQEKAFAARRQACYGKLVAEPCLREAIEDNARAERRIHATEVEARGFKRQHAEREVHSARDAQRVRVTADAPRQQAERARTNAARKQQADRQAKAARDFAAAAPERAARAARETRREEARVAARQRKNKEEAALSSARRTA